MCSEHTATIFQYRFLPQAFRMFGDLTIAEGVFALLIRCRCTISTQGNNSSSFSSSSEFILRLLRKKHATSGTVCFALGMSATETSSRISQHTLS
jgi:hypothetical protein